MAMRCYREGNSLRPQPGAMRTDPATGLSFSEYESASQQIVLSCCLTARGPIHVGSNHF